MMLPDSKIVEKYCLGSTKQEKAKSYTEIKQALALTGHYRTTFKN